MKMKYDTTTLEGKIAVMQRWFHDPQKLHINLGVNRWVQYYRESVPNWNWQDHDYNYPAEPELPKLVPWTFETCPHLATAAFRYKEPAPVGYLLPSAVGIGGVTMGRVEASWDHLLNRMEVSLDNGRTWLPCGMEEKP